MIHPNQIQVCATILFLNVYGFSQALKTRIGYGFFHLFPGGTVVDNQSPQIGYLGGKLMYRRDFFRIELQISKDVEKAPSEVFPMSN